jgi:2'-5' RNA ligase
MVTGAKPLYLMLKPPPSQRAALRRCVTGYGLDAGYAPEKYHCTLLRLGESELWSPAMLDALCRLLRTVDAEPCAVAFDRLEGSLLRGRKGLTGLRELQRKLARQACRLGVPLPEFRFSPHVSLAYGAAPDRKNAIAPIGWLATEFLLVRSVHGVGHEPLGSWPLRRRQYELPFYRGGAQSSSSS